jgi:hypothetical protein
MVRDGEIVDGTSSISRLALKFAEEPGWHCVWATMAEYDGDFGPCTFRSFEDVYLAELTHHLGCANLHLQGKDELPAGVADSSAYPVTV